MAANSRSNFFLLAGDANHDGRVNLDDFNVLAANFGQTRRELQRRATSTTTAR